MQTTWHSYWNGDIQNNDNTNFRSRIRTTRFWLIVGRNTNWYSTFVKIVWQFLAKLNIHMYIHNRPSNFTPCFENLCFKTYTWILLAPEFKWSQTGRITYPWVNNSEIMYVYSGIELSNKWNSDVSWILIVSADYRKARREG